jgi:hypothetical protein
VLEGMTLLAKKKKSPRLSGIAEVLNQQHIKISTALKKSVHFDSHLFVATVAREALLTGGEGRSTRFWTSVVNRSEFTRRIQRGPAPGQPEADDESRPTSARPLPGKSTRLAAGPPPAERLYVLSPVPASTLQRTKVALRKASSSRPRRLLPWGMPPQSPPRLERRAKAGVGPWGRVRAGESTRRKREHGSGGWEWGAPPGSLLRRQSETPTQAGQQ